MSQNTLGSNRILFYDTYALYAIATGQENYRPFIEGHLVLTSLMNLYELYYTLLQSGKEELAVMFFQRLISSCISITPEIIKDAARFRYEHMKQKFSYIDCLGFTLAKKQGVLFLTGDDAFKTFPSVLFVK